MTAYDVVFERILTRVDPERAHRLGFAGIRRPSGPLRRPRPPSRTGARDGADVPAPPWGWRPGSTRTPSASTRSPHWASGTSRSAPSRASRSPATRGRDCSGCRPTGPWSTGWASTTTAPRPWPDGSPVGDAAGRRAGHQHRQDQGGARGRPGGGDRRLHQVGPAARPARRLPRGQRQLAQHPGAAQPAGGRPAGAAAGRRTTGGRRQRRAGTCRCWSRSPRTSPTTTSLEVADLALAQSLDGIIATNTTISRDGLRTPTSEVEALGPVGSPARRWPRGRSRCCTCSRSRSGDDLTLVSVGGITHRRGRPDPPRRGRHARAGLHRLRLRRAAVAAAHPRRDRRGVTTPVHVTGEVLASRKAGAYRMLTLVAPGVAERFRPGTFVALSVGESLLGRRAFWVHRVKPTGGYGTTLDIVVIPGRCRYPLAGRTAARVPGRGHRPTGSTIRAAEGARALSAHRRGVRRRAAVPAGRAAPRARAAPTTLVIGAADEAHLLNALEARRSAGSVTVVTADGSVGERGDLADLAAKFVGARPTWSTPRGPCRCCGRVAAGRRGPPGAGASSPWSGR